jgi:hypothetical protein
MKFRHTAALALAMACIASQAMADVRLSIHDGHVSLSATNATVPQILAEWAKVGRTKVVNGDRASGPPMALELTNVPEAEALQIILRSVSGYLLAPRRVTAPDASTYDRILIIPATRAVSPASPVQAGPSPGPSQPTFAQQLFGRRGEETGDAAPPEQTQPGRPPFNFPQPATAGAPPQDAAPAAPSAPSTAPVVPGGVPFPGMLPPPPPASPQNGQGRQQP